MLGKLPGSALEGGEEGEEPHGQPIIDPENAGVKVVDGQ